MDDLDRLAFRLVRTIRQEFPALRSQGFTLSDLEERLLPHRDARREMAHSGADAWERTLLRLLAGERSYVRADAEVQRACRDALASPSPTIALVRRFAMSTLMLGEAVESVGTERANVSAADPIAERITAPVATAVDPAKPRRSLSRNTPRAVRAEARAPDRAHRAADGPTCRFCSGALPDGRTVTFCPRCGVDQTKRQCPACSTELETAWRFCVTCGRSADIPDLPAKVTRVAS